MLYTTLSKQIVTLTQFRIPIMPSIRRKGTLPFSITLTLILVIFLKIREASIRYQGIVSLDDEQDDDYTKILPSMYHNIIPWYNYLKACVVVKDSKVKLGSLVSKISSNLFTKEDKKEFNCDQTTIPCQSREVHITQPHLLHSVKGLTK